MSVTDVVQPTTDDADQTIYIAVGAAVGLGLLVLVAGSDVLVVWLVKRKHSKQGLLTRIHTVVYMATLTHLFLCVYAHTGDVPSSSEDALCRFQVSWYPRVQFKVRVFRAPVVTGTVPVVLYILVRSWKDVISMVLRQQNAPTSNATA